MTIDPAYPARPIKRWRSTKVEVEQRRRSLLEIVGDMQPMTVRQVFYQATVRGLVEKSEAGYAKVQDDLARLRRAGDLPYDWLADNTRWPLKPRTFDGIEEALQDAATTYRKALWADADAYVQVWLEKDALTGVIYPVTASYDVSLMVARGYASLSFLYRAAEPIARLEVPTFIYHLGDHDPSGVNAGEKIEETLRELAPGAEITFERIAVTPEQITDWNLPTRPTKQTDARAKGFGSDVSVELDAIEPSRLRGRSSRPVLSSTFRRRGLQGSRRPRKGNWLRLPAWSVACGSQLDAAANGHRREPSAGEAAGQDAPARMVPRQRLPSRNWLRRRVARPQWLRHRVSSKNSRGDFRKRKGPLTERPLPKKSDQMPIGYTVTNRP